MEIWKDILWYEWLYKISNLWNIKSLWKWKTHNSKETILKSNLNTWKYLKISLYKNWIWRTITIHRLVAQAFIPNINNKPFINHKDWNKQNNCVNNLEWCTNSENQKHSINVLWNKTMFSVNHYNKWKFWKHNHRSKKINQYDLDWSFIKTWDSMMDIERELKIKNSNICACCKWRKKTYLSFIWKYYD